MTPPDSPPPALVQAARAALENAYAPYSKFPVAAALETASGRIFTGCNVENLSFGLTLCAERVALTTAIAAGERSFSRVLILSTALEPISPCGACRQVLAEFHPTLPVWSMGRDGQTLHWSLDYLLPRPKIGILHLEG